MDTSTNRSSPRSRVPHGTAPIVNPTHAGDDAPDVEVAKEAVGDTLRNTQRLLDGYVELIKYDVREELLELRWSLVFALIAIFGGGTVVLLLALAGATTLAAHTSLSQHVALFVASGGVALVTLCAFLLARKTFDPVKIETIPEAKEDAQWIKDNA